MRDNLIGALNYYSGKEHDYIAGISLRVELSIENLLLI
ncbi:hypothetical protein XSR1_50035 [Xenorhabdus szentirmaii DSM 16338]|uniref:Uncharacterized protein n=1 Tax=Xenorhabdus szentirmaii DSM 16338 TaxID=1427518 RepID=W1J3I2_9GAMM|nr:hypothetical protein XSR1_50035 [Xenorhabdus szentirmaii DSM 16338]